MKKTIITMSLVVSMLISLIVSVSAVKYDYHLERFISALPWKDNRRLDIELYETCEEIEYYIEENINNYFLPVAYDVSPFSAKSYERLDPEKFYKNSVVYDDRGKIVVPPMYTAVIDCNVRIGIYTGTVFEPYLLYEYANKNNMEMTDTMWRTLNKYSDNRKYSSLDTAINAFIAPWTLYNEGKLYAWPEIMEMNEDEINALDFESYEFYTFISGVKEALETRGW